MKKKHIIILIICLVLIFGLAISVDKLSEARTEQHRSSELTEGQQNAEDAAQQGEEENSAQENTDDATPYECPIDFASLQKQNKDIYAWLEIPGTDISYPVLQSSKDDSYYLNHGENGKYDERGALFTEGTYNGTDFSDPVTVIYGHRIKSGKFFGKLQQLYTDDFEKYPELVIYTPEEEIRYSVFAAVSFSNRHILYYYDCFKDSSMMDDFMEDLYGVRNIGSYVDKNVKIENTDRLLVLSTCLQGDRTCRFLVIGKRID